MEWGGCETKYVEDEPIFLRPCATNRPDGPPQPDEELQASAAEGVVKLEFVCNKPAPSTPAQTAAFCSQGAQTDVRPIAGPAGADGSAEFWMGFRAEHLCLRGITWGGLENLAQGRARRLSFQETAPRSDSS